MPVPEIEDPAGHWLGAPVLWRGERVVRALYGTTACSCLRDHPQRRRHSTVSCQRPGCGWVHYDPPCGGEEWIRRALP